MIEPKVITYKGKVLHQGQQKIVKEILSDPAMFYTLVTPRQWGKSTFAIQLMLYYAINYKDSKVMFASLTYRQSRKVQKELVKGIIKSGIIKETDGTRNSITLINGTEIFFVSVHNPDSLLGEDINYMFVDEASRCKEETFNSTLRPMLRVAGKKCFLFSTPKGKNWFYKMFKLGQEPLELRYRSFKGCNEDNPFGNKEELEDAKKKLPDALYRQEYMAEFIDDGGEVFQNIKDISILKQWPTKIQQSYYAGVDVARKNDYTVVTIMGQDGKVYAILRTNKKEWTVIANEVAALLNQWKPKTTFVETNGVGDVFFEILKKKYSNIESWTNTNSSKQQIIEELIVDFQDKKLSIPTEALYPILYDELLDFGFEYSAKTRNIHYAAISGHDDCIISLALANHVRKHFANKGRYLIA